MQSGGKTQQYIFVIYEQMFGFIVIRKRNCEMSEQIRIIHVNNYIHENV